MHRIIAPAVLAALLVAGCAGGPGSPSTRAVVQGAGAELLKLRAGPGLGFNVILGLPDGTALVQRGCVTEVGQRWCRVSLERAPNISGYVSADYLSSR
ncbi:SH3 domain-containing protein [Roseinatronobacter sp.]|uniref:SH3 domain-containing protein n=1 Tax=Roseinatronobacter sp. TaxID=1945755 RepID=UPI003F72FAF4